MSTARMTQSAARETLIFTLALIAWACVIVSPNASADATHEQRGAGSAPARTIVWISIDGVRPDYVNRVRTLTIDRLSNEGAFSRELVPVFPSLTFPSHVSQATGVKVQQHGISSNSFIDRSTWRIHRYPWDSRLLEAEPIWLTAARQGVRVAVYDWPLSHAQQGEVTTEYFGPRYIRGLSDEERLGMLLEAWEKDINETREQELDRAPLRLLMGYIVGPDSAGHAEGPRGREPLRMLRESDQIIGRFLEQAVRFWEEQREPDDELYVILSTDHGMSEVHTLVHLGYLAEIEDDSQDIETITSGNIGHIFVREGEDDDEAVKAKRDGRTRTLVERINAHEFVRAWLREELPEKWAYAHPTRCGDIVIVLDTGYTFSRRPRSVTADAREHGGPLGMHGYDPRENPEMNGYLVIWRYPEPLGGFDLGRVHSLQLHATVAKLLGIEPADGALNEPVTLERRAAGE